MLAAAPSTFSASKKPVDPRALGAESAQHDRRASRAASIGAMRIRAARDYRIKEIASGTAAT